MTPTRVKVRQNGPYKVTGPVEVTDHEDRALLSVAEGESVALCRCGRTDTAPRCDRSHRRQPEWRPTAPDGT